MRNFHTVLVAASVMVVGLALSFSGEEAGAQNQPGGPGELSFETSGEEGFAPGRMIVKVEESAPGQALEDLNRRNGARVDRELPGVRTSLVDLPASLPVEVAVQRYKNDPAVEYAEPDFKIEPSQVTPNDPGFPELYGLNNTGQSGGTEGADTDAPEAWTETTGSSDTIIAVIDTGTDITHPDLRNNLWTNPDETENGRDDDGNGYVDDVNGWDFYNDDNTVYDEADGENHGTHISGTVAAEGNNDVGVTGVNWDARIMPLKFIGPDGGFVSDAVAAIDYAVDNGATISNNSWGGTSNSRILQEAIGRAGQEGHLFVAAAGNDGTDNDERPFYPASYGNENIISVTATDRNDGLASFSNFGNDSVDLGAPGVQILSTLPEHNYGYASGTSMASPHVAGIAGLLKSANPEWGVAKTKRAILNSADAKRSLRGKTVTGSRANAADALSGTDTTLYVGSSTLTFGQRTNLFGDLTDVAGDPIAGEEVVLLQRPVDGSSFSRVPDGTATTNSNGHFVMRGVEPEKNTVYRVRYAGNRSAGLDLSVSAPEVIHVRVRLTMNVAKDRLQTGEAQGVAGRVLPDHAGEVRLKILRDGQRFDVRWIALQDSVFRYNFRPSEPGTYRVSAVFPKDDDHLGNHSPVRTFEVDR